MKQKDLEKLSKIDNIEEVLEHLSSFYPDLELKSYRIEEFERNLFHNYIKMIGQVMSYSPENMRLFLEDFMLKYEISNIKHLILTSIIGLETEKKSEYVNFLVEKYLDNKDFIEGLIDLYSLDEIQYYMKNTQYYKPVREGISYFKNTNEVFVLVSFLDQIYFKNLDKNFKQLNKTEKRMIGGFINYSTEIFNLDMIYRGIINNIEKKLLSQFIVDRYFFLNGNKIDKLLKQEDLGDFLITLSRFINNVEGLTKILDLKEEMEPIQKLEKEYQDHFFKRFQKHIDQIEYTTIKEILELIIKKDSEIKSQIIPKIVKLLQPDY